MPVARNRQRFVDDAIATASPARLLCLLYDRLLVDLRLGRAALDEGDRADAARLLGHAQEIVLELRASLDTSAWDGGPALASLYTWLLGELGGAIAAGDPTRVDGCESVVAPLRETWHEAAASVSLARSA